MMVKQKKMQNVTNIPLDSIRMDSFHAFSIERYNGWIYSALRNRGGRLHPDYAGDESKQLVKMFTGFIGSSYMMNEMKSFYIEDDHPFKDNDTNGMTTDQYRRSVLKETKRVLKAMDKQYLSCRLVGDKYSFMLVIYIDDSSVYYTSALFDGNNMTCKCCLDVESRVDGFLTVHRTYDSPFYLCRKDRSVETILKNDVDIHTTDVTTMALISECLKQLVSGKEEVTDMHTSTEMYFIKKVIKSVNPNFWPTDVRNWISPGHENYGNNNFKESTFCIVEELIKERYDSYPLIDLGTKEMNFVINYAINHGVLSENDGTINLLPYVTESSYGDVFRYPLTYNGSSGEVLCGFILDQEFNDLRMIMVLEIPENDVIVFSTVDYENIKEFNYITSCRGCNTSLICRNINTLPQDLQELNIGFKSLFLDAKIINKILTTIIALCVVIKDRPSRTKMVTCTQRIPKEPKARSSRSKQKEEYDFVVSRILKTSKEAKEYVARMSSDGCPDREYTIESWPRKGYYRRVRGGGTVWIPPTTCHRHQPLSEKEIHIKL